MEQIDGTLLMRPSKAAASEMEMDYVPFFGDYTVACGPDAPTSWSDHASTEIPIRKRSEQALTPSAHFVCFARGDSMNGGPSPIRHGDPLLFEWITGGSARDYVDQPVLVEAVGKTGVSATLKVLRRSGGGYLLESTNPAVSPIEGRSDMRPVARLLTKLDQTDINPLAPRIGEQYKSMDVPPLYGEVYNPGNWRSGHVSLRNHAILFVSLEKRADRPQYTEHFEGPDIFVWSSQMSTAPEGKKKGREILQALETGKSIELWMRRKGNDVAFTYLGRVVPISYEGVQADVGDVPTPDASVGRPPIAARAATVTAASGQFGRAMDALSRKRYLTLVAPPAMRSITSWRQRRIPADKCWRRESRADRLTETYDRVSEAEATKLTFESLPMTTQAG